MVKSAGNPGFSHETWAFPVDFPTDPLPPPKATYPHWACRAIGFGHRFLDWLQEEVLFHLRFAVENGGTLGVGGWKYMKEIPKSFIKK